MDNQYRSLSPDIIERDAIYSSQAIDAVEDFDDAPANNDILLYDPFARDRFPPLVLTESHGMTQSQTREESVFWNVSIPNSNGSHTDIENFQIPEDSPLKSGTYVNVPIQKMSSPRKRKHRGDKVPKKGGGRRRKRYPEPRERLDPLYRDESMKFYGIQSQSRGYENEEDSKKRFGFIASKYKVSHDNALCAVLKKESEHDYKELPRDQRIFDFKHTPELSGFDFKRLDFECVIIDTSDWWHARYNTNEFLYENYCSKNVFLISDLKIDEEVIPKYSILSGYKINDEWKSICFGVGRKKQTRTKGKNADKNAWKINFHGDPFFFPEDNPQEDPEIAIEEIREICVEDMIQLRVLVFTETAQFGKPGSLKDVSKVLAEKIEEKLRAQHDCH